MGSIAMQMPGIYGGKHTAGHQDQIDLLSFSHGVAMPVTGDGGAEERTSGRPLHQDFVITKHLDQISPLVNQACAEGRSVKQVKIIADMNDGSQMTYTLHDTIISSVTISGGGGDKPVEVVMLNYARIKWELQTSSETIEGTWDITKNRVG